MFADPAPPSGSVPTPVFTNRPTPDAPPLSTLESIERLAGDAPSCISTARPLAAAASTVLRTISLALPFVIDSPLPSAPITTASRIAVPPPALIATAGAPPEGAATMSFSSTLGVAPLPPNVSVPVITTPGDIGRAADGDAGRERRALAVGPR